MELFAEKARKQGAVVQVLLATENEETRERMLEELRQLLPSTVRVYYDQGLRVYYDHNPDRNGYPFGKSLVFAAVHIEEVWPDGRGRIAKGLYGPQNLPQHTEPRRPSALDYILDDDD